MTLPADGHVHSEFSWDTGGPSSAAAGRMRLTCARAVAIGLPTVVSHVPEALAGNFPEAMVMAEHFGFRPGSRPEELWTR